MRYAAGSRRDTVYTRGLQTRCLVSPGPPNQDPVGTPVLAGGWGIGSEPFGVAQRDTSPGRDTGQCKTQELQRPHANSSSHPQSYSLDMAVVKSAVVLHLQRENTSYDTGMQDSPTATMMAR